jgi:hypothetical protein
MRTVGQLGNYDSSSVDSTAGPVTPESCAQLVERLRGLGAPTVADYLEGRAVYDPDYRAQLNALAPIDRALVDGCVYLRAEDVMAAKAATYTPEELAAIEAWELAQLEAFAAGKPGETGYIGPGKGITKAGQLAAYGQIQAKIDAKDDPLAFIKGDASLFGLKLPRWVLWAAGGLVTYWAVSKLADPKAWRKRKKRTVYTDAWARGEE